MLLGFIMLWSGLLGHLDFAASLPPTPAMGLTVALNLACFGSLYALLETSTRPLCSSAQHYQQLAERPNTDPAAKASAKMLSWQFKCAQRYIWVTWHLFPLVWSLAAFGWIDASMRENWCCTRPHPSPPPHKAKMLTRGCDDRYVVCDLFAKFLPVSMYLSLLDVRY